MLVSKDETTKYLNVAYNGAGWDALHPAHCWALPRKPAADDRCHPAQPEFVQAPVVARPVLGHTGRVLQRKSQVVGRYGAHHIGPVVGMGRVVLEANVAHQIHGGHNVEAVVRVSAGWLLKKDTTKAQR